MVLGSTGCAPTPSPSNQAGSTKLTINLDTGRAIFPNRQVALIDCSNRAFQCLEASGEFLLAFPKLCSLADDNPFYGWDVAGYRFSATAPTPHLGMPNGGYYSAKYPHIHLGYRVGMGFVTLTQTKGTPSQAGWNPGDFVEEYRIVYVGGASRFGCI